MATVVDVVDDVAIGGSVGPPFRLVVLGAPGDGDGCDGDHEAQQRPRAIAWAEIVGHYPARPTT